MLKEGWLQTSFFIFIKVCYNVCAIATAKLISILLEDAVSVCLLRRILKDRGKLLVCSGMNGSKRSFHLFFINEISYNIDVPKRTLDVSLTGAYYLMEKP